MTDTDRYEAELRRNVARKERLAKWLMLVGNLVVAGLKLLSTYRPYR